jgi:hypothetical protein
MKGFFTQGFIILLNNKIDLSKMRENLQTYNIVKETPANAEWTISGPAYIIEYKKDINGYISIDLVDKVWPDGMGDPKDDPKLFAAWSMGHFGPYAYSGGLSRAIQQSWGWQDVNVEVSKHCSFLRLRLSYSFGAEPNSPLGPKNYDPIEELTFMTSMAASLLNSKYAICYYNPNGEILLNKMMLDESFNFCKQNNLPALNVWSNIRLFNVAENWCLMDSVGSLQFDLPDHELCYPKGEYKPEEVDRFIRNITLYLIKNGRVIKNGDTGDGPGNIKWRASLMENSLSDPPRETIRWVPSNISKIPDVFKKN